MSDHDTSVPELQRALRELHLPGMSATLAERARQVDRGQLTFLDALTLLVRDELEHRNRRALERRFPDSDVQGGKTLEDFDRAYNPEILRDDILELATLDFIAEREPVLFVGPPRCRQESLRRRACASGSAAWLPGRVQQG